MILAYRAFLIQIRRRPTLLSSALRNLDLKSEICHLRFRASRGHGRPYSTIGAEGLNDRVRESYGRSAIAAKADRVRPGWRKTLFPRIDDQAQRFQCLDAENRLIYLQQESKLCSALTGSQR